MEKSNKELNQWFYGTTEDKRLAVASYYSDKIINTYYSSSVWNSMSIEQKRLAYSWFGDDKEQGGGMAQCNTTENVIRPNYYHRFGVESVDIAEGMYGTRNMVVVGLATAFFYITRIGDKKDNPPQQELDKANWWLGKVDEWKRKIQDGNEVKGAFDLDTFVARQ